MPGNPKHSSEGRITNLHLPNLTVVNTYLPSGNRTADRHNYKLEFQDDLKTHCEQLRITRDVILVSDFNTIRNYTDVLQGLETDIVDQFPSTTTPDEKTWLNSLETLFTDSFREKYSQTGATWLIKAPNQQHYPFWRIDYIWVDKRIPVKAYDTRVEAPEQEPLSDHLKIQININFNYLLEVADEPYYPHGLEFDNQTGTMMTVRNTPIKLQRNTSS
ncbi:hypothetical protein BCR33DRAFT_739933 [Rhizoclosmatium globosum]|uniref:DNase I-like protein n=1 Tax=Rhizoclosmatium globosum TaxID=329046 RepID=A0A1Y2C3R0_9FUNG|nr:hypothetical protein BCR33DRAFT_739933 [Rhizoclosmatium globosum]|eukprot:ORY40945.1 hypothetical protein BCR33DRAFT_739933 [Rhizoclosmatium globosum]